MLVACPIPGKKKSVDICNAFIQGAPRNVDGYVFYGVGATNLGEWQQALHDYDRPFYLIDNAYFDSARQQYFRVTKNRFQHSGLGISDCRRFEQLGVMVYPWRNTPGEHIILIEQSDDFMQTVGGTTNHRWLHQTSQALASLAPNRPVELRPWSRDKAFASTTLDLHLVNAHALITWSSAAAITALLRGVPVCCFGQCAAEPLSTPLRLIENPIEHSVEQRYNWAGLLADNQFTIDEMRNGYAWRALHG